MKHDQFLKCVDQRLRLEPAAIGPNGQPLDDDWTIADPDASHKSATLRNLIRGGEVVIGFDHVKNYDTDPARGADFGFLNMLWQVRIDREGGITSRPIPARAPAPQVPKFRPLVVKDGETDRHFTWASTGDPVDLLPEGQPRQLLGAYVRVCDALRQETNKEPQFDPPTEIRHEIIWELTPDQQAKHKLLGGRGGKPGTAVLVLTDNRAQAVGQLVADTTPPEVEWVDMDYQSRSGLQEEIRASGFKEHWVREELVARRRARDWEVVVAEHDGRPVTFRVASPNPSADPSALVLMKRRA
jgi:hypothetical protein